MGRGVGDGRDTGPGQPLLPDDASSHGLHS